MLVEVGLQQAGEVKNDGHEDNTSSRKFGGGGKVFNHTRGLILICRYLWKGPRFRA